MNNRIKELEKMIKDPDIEISEVLPYALVLASKHDEKIIPWIKQEMDGYESEKDCPTYRHVSGIPQTKNVHGNDKWRVYINSDSDMQTYLKSMLIQHEISILETWKNNSHIFTRILYDTSTQGRLNKECLSEDPFGENSEFVLEIHYHAINQILNRVRRDLLIWVLGLSEKEESSSSTTPSKIIFSQELISRLPDEIKILADDFNFNFSHNRAYACMLILRRILPLSIVKKFQENGQEEIIKKGNEYLNTMPLLAKAESLITERRYKEIISYKKFLDASQHSYTFSIDTSDALNVATTLRLILDEFFPNKDNNKNQ